MNLLPEREYSMITAAGELAVCEWGKEGSYPLLMLHGWLDNAATFFTLAPHLCGHFRCIALDFPGHGRSAHLGPHASYHFVDGVVAIRALLQKLDIDECVLLGHSMGGALGLLYAGAFGRQITQLVSLEAFGPLLRDEQDTALLMAQGCDDRLMRVDSRKRVYASIDEALAVRAAVGDIGSALLRPLVERNLDAVEGGFRWRSDARLRLPSLLRMTHAQLTDFTTRITARSLLIRASMGMSFVVKALEKHRHEMPDLQEIVMEGGHHFHLEQPQECAQQIMHFLSEGRVPLGV